MDDSLVRIRHERSKKDFPGLKLGENEYVELMFERAQAELWFVWWAIGAVMAGALMILLLVISTQSTLNSWALNYALILLACIAVGGIGMGLLAFFIHRENRLFITNRRVILENVRFPWTRAEQSAELADVTEVSLAEEGWVSQRLKCGTLKFMTEKETFEFPGVKVTEGELAGVRGVVKEAAK